MNNKLSTNFSLRKLLFTALIAGPLVTVPAPLWALPSVASSNLTTSSNVTVTQLSATAINVTAGDKGVLTWQRFGDGTQPFSSGESISFFQPSATSSVLNVVNGGFYSNGGSVDSTFASLIAGTITANGNVYFLNPNGITIGNGAQINVGGFYASTIGETLPAANFSITGSLSFSGATVSTPAIQTASGASVQAVGSGLNIKLYGKGANIGGGNFYGNLFVATNGGNMTVGNGASLPAGQTASDVTVNAVAGSGGKLTVNTAGGDAILSGGSTLLYSGATDVQLPATISGNAVISATVGKAQGNASAGKITTYTVLNGGTGYTTGNYPITVQDAAGVSFTYNAAVTAAAGVITAITAPTGYNTATTAGPSGGTSGGLTVSGGLAVDTTGSSANGKIYQGGAEIIAQGASTLTTGASSTGGNISLGAASFQGLSVNANNVSIVGQTSANTPPTGANDLTLNASNVYGGLTLVNNGGQILAGTGASTVGGTISLSASGNTTSFTGSGALTFGLLQATSTVSIVSSGDITLPYSQAVAPNFNPSTMAIPTITAAPVGGTSAVLAAPTIPAGVVTGITVPPATAGVGYTQNPIVTLAPGFSGAAPIQLPASIAAGSVTSVTLPSTNFNTITGVTVNSGNATVNPALGGITLNNVGQIQAVASGTLLSSAGSGYTTPPTVTVTGSNGVTQTFNTTINSSGAIASIVVPPTAGSGATASGITSNSGGTIRVINVTSSGGKITGGLLYGNSTVNLIAAGDITIAGVTENSSGYTFNMTSNTGKITAGFINSASGGSVKAAGDILVGGYSSGLLGNLTQGSSASSMSVTSTAGTITAGAITSTTTAGLTLTAFNDITLPQTTFANMTVVSTSGNIAQNANTYLVQNAGNSSNNSLTLNAAKDVSLASTIIQAGAAGVYVTNDINRLVLLNGGGGTVGFTINSYNTNTSYLPLAGTPKATIVSNNTKAVGPVSITSPTSVLLGTPATNSAGNYVNGSDVLSFAGGISITANGTNANAITNSNNALAPLTGTINTFANNITSFGNVSLTTASNQNAILGTPGLGTASYAFGAVSANVGTGTVTINENTTLNLGTIVAATLNATSIGGDIVNTQGTGIAVSTANFTSKSIFSPGDVTLSNTANAISQINLINVNNANLTTGSSGAGTTVTVGSLTQNGKAVLGTLYVNELNGKNVTVNSAGGGTFNLVGFNSTLAGNVTINAPGSITLQNITNTGTGAVTVSAPGTITLGSGIALNSTGATTLTATGTSGKIVDSAPNVSIYGAANLTADTTIAITKSGHSFGPVSLVTNGTGGLATDITYTEAGTANLNLVKVNSTGAGADGSLAVVSTSGSIVQYTPNTAPNATNGYIIVPTVGNANTATFQAAGGIQLTNPNNTVLGQGNKIDVPVALSAATDSVLNQSQGARGVILGNVTIKSGGLVVDTSAAAGGVISQAAGTIANIFGTSGFKTNNAKITLTNSGNNFGAVSLASNGGAVSISEAGTLNLASVVTGAGALSAASENAGIVESSTVATFGGTAATAGLNVGGAASFTASSAAGSLALSGSNTAVGSGGITLNVKGNATIADSAQTTTFGPGSTVGGSLVVRNTYSGAGTSTIGDGGLGNVAITGSVLFDAGSGSISFSGPSNTFGNLQFRGGSVAISSANSMSLAAGNVALGAVTLSSNQDINMTSGLGTSTFSTSLTLSSGGNITISSPIYVGNGLTFLAKGNVDLSALSLFGNLNSKTPVNLGAASYKQPGS